MAEQTIDRLQVEVEATAKGTSAVFDQLERRLQTVQKALEAIDTSKLTAVQNAVNKTNVNVNTSGMSKAEKDVSKSVTRIQQMLAGLGAYANAAMGGDKSAFHSFERGATRVQSDLDILKEKFAQLGNTRIDTKEWSDLQRKMEDTKSALDAFEKKRQEMTDTGPGQKNHEEYVELLHSIRDCNFELEKLKAKQDELVNTGKDSYDPLAPYRESLKETEQKLGEMTSKVKTAMDGMNKTPSPKPDTKGLKDVTKEAEKARAALKKMFDGAVHKTLSKLGSALKKIASALLGIGHNSGGVKKGFMTILKYGFGIRSLYVLFRRLRKAVVESFQELQNSGAFYEETRANIEDLKNSLTLLKYQFGAAFEPIFNAVAPALKAFVNNLVSAMNSLSAFMAKLMGKNTYSKAVLNAGALADKTGKAAKAQKELNKQLQGFDELNNLTTNKSNPNSGSGGSSDEVPGAVYVTESVDNALGDFGKMLANKITAGDWKGVGEAISDKLSTAMENIQWKNIFQKAKDFGTNLAKFLNGLINPRLFENIGRTIGKLITTGLLALNSFAKEFKWKEFGQSLAAGFNAWVKEGNFALLGETLHTWIAGALDAAIEFFDKVDFEEVGKQIAEFIGNLDIPDLVKKLAKLAWKIIEALAEAIKGLWNDSSLLGKIGLAIVGIIGLAKLTGLLTTLGALIKTALTGQTLSVAAAGFTLKLAGISFILSGIGMIAGMELAGSVEKNPLIEPNATDMGKVLAGTALTTGGAGLFGGTISALKGMGFLSGFKASAGVALPAVMAQVLGSFTGNALGRTMFSDPESIKYYDEYAGFGISPTKTIKGYIDIIKGFAEGNGWKAVKEMASEDTWSFWSFFGTLGDNIYDNLEPLFELLDPSTGYMSDLGSIISGWFGSDTATSVADAWGKVNEKLNTTTNTYKGLGEVAKSVDTTTKDLTTHTTQFGNEAVNSNTKFANGIKDIPKKSLDTFSNAYKNGTKTWSGIGGWAKQKATELNSGFNGMPTAVSEKFGQAYTDSTNKWSSIGSWAVGITTKTKDGMSQLPTSTSKQFGDAYSQSTSKWNNIGSWAVQKSALINSTFSTFSGSASKQFGDAYTQGTSKWNTIGSWAQKTFDTVSQNSDRSLNKIPSQFANSFQNGTSQAESKVSIFSSWLSNVNLVKKAGVEADERSISNVKYKIESLNRELSRNKNITITVTGSGFEAIGSKIRNLTDQISRLKTAKSGISTGSSLSSLLSVKLFASGGVVGGATPAIVGEAGPEAILPLTDGTIGKLASFIVGEMASPSMPVMAQNSYNGYSTSGASASDIAEQNRLLAEQNQLLRVIADKELTVSTREVFEATRKESNNYYNRTGESPFFY